MEKNTYCVTVGGEKRSYEEGTSYQAIARDFQKDYPHDIDDHGYQRCLSSV